MQPNPPAEPPASSAIKTQMMVILGLIFGCLVAWLLRVAVGPGVALIAFILIVGFAVARVFMAFRNEAGALEMLQSDHERALAAKRGDPFVEVVENGYRTDLQDRIEETSSQEVFYLLDNESKGPIPLLDVLHMIADGLLLPTTQVRPVHDNNWTEVEGELLAEIIRRKASNDPRDTLL